MHRQGQNSFWPEWYAWDGFPIKNVNACALARGALAEEGRIPGEASRERDATRLPFPNGMKTGKLSALDYENSIYLIYYRNYG